LRRCGAAGLVPISGRHLQPSCGAVDVGAGGNPADGRSKRTSRVNKALTPIRWRAARASSARADIDHAARDGIAVFKHILIASDRSELASGPRLAGSSSPSSSTPGDAVTVTEPGRSSPERRRWGSRSRSRNPRQRMPRASRRRHSDSQKMDSCAPRHTSRIVSRRRHHCHGQGARRDLIVMASHGRRGLACCSSAARQPGTLSTVPVLICRWCRRMLREGKALCALHCWPLLPFDRVVPACGRAATPNRRCTFLSANCLFSALSFCGARKARPKTQVRDFEVDSLLIPCCSAKGVTRSVCPSSGASHRRRPPMIVNSNDDETTGRDALVAWPKCRKAGCKDMVRDLIGEPRTRDRRLQPHPSNRRPASPQGSVTRQGVGQVENNPCTGWRRRRRPRLS
jgi:hypothetical protein